MKRPVIWAHCWIALTLIYILVMQLGLLHHCGRQRLEKGLAKNMIWGKMSSQVIIFAFLSASLSNPQLILKDPVMSIVLSAKECVCVKRECPLAPNPSHRRG